MGQSRSLDPTRNVEALPVFGLDHSCRGWVRIDWDRIGHEQETPFSITIDTSSYLSPYEARAFADQLNEAARRVAARLLLSRQSGTDS